jgi:hypothetical protein
MDTHWHETQARARPPKAKLLKLQGEKFVRLSESQVKELSRRVPGRLWPWALQAVMWVTSEQGRGEHRRGLLLGGRKLRAKDFALALARAESTSKKRLVELEKAGFILRERGQHGCKTWVLGFQKFEDAPGSDESAMGCPSDPTHQTDTLRGVTLNPRDETAMGGESDTEPHSRGTALGDVCDALSGGSGRPRGAGNEVPEQKAALAETPSERASGSAGRPPKAETPPAVGVNGISSYRREGRTATADGQRLSREDAGKLDYYPEGRCDMTHEEWYEARKAHLRRQAERLMWPGGVTEPAEQVGEDLLTAVGTEGEDT